jgi:hypothetical protein
MPSPRGNRNTRKLVHRSPRGFRKTIGNAWQSFTGLTRRAGTALRQAGNRVVGFFNPVRRWAEVRAGNRERHRERRKAERAASSARNARIRNALGDRTPFQLSVSAHASSLRNSLRRTRKSISNAFTSLTRR